MKKLIITGLALLSCGIVYALPLGNPTGASLYQRGVWTSGNECDGRCFSVQIGFYGDYVFNRNLEIDGTGTIQGTVIGGSIEETEIVTNAGYLALTICERIDVFGTLGASKLILTSNEASWRSVGNANARAFTESDLSWSVGARGTLFQWNCFGMGIEGQYFRVEPDLTSFWSCGTGGEYIYFNENNKTIYQEWQVGLGLSYTFTIDCPKVTWTPYGGVKWAWAKFDTDDFSFQMLGDPFVIFDMKANKLWGYAVGISFTLCDMIGASVEGRFGDESALYINGQVSF